MNYYNEYDSKAAAWLRELIKAGLIPNGDVDERSIAEVKPDELRHYTQCHFFAGIGGWSLALQLAGWPADRPVWTGSCPCQPFSSAGKGLGDKDERHLWPVFFNLIKECRPNTVFGEQVASAIGKGWLDGISSDLESEDYACGSVVLGAHSVGSPHIRQRLYWVADSDNDDRQRGSYAGTMGETCSGIKNTRKEFRETISDSCDDDRLADSDSGRLQQRDEGVGSADGWQRVVFSGDCDKDGNCPKCGIDYADCECLGPTQDGVEYEEFDGVLYGRMGNAIKQGLEGQSRHGNDGSEPRRIVKNTIGSITETSADGRMEHTECCGLMGCSVCNGESVNARREEKPNNNWKSGERCADVSGLVLTNSDGCQQGSDATTTAGHGGSTESAGGGVEWLAHTDGGNQQSTGSRLIEHGLSAGSGDGFRTQRIEELTEGNWNDSRLVACRDGKARRIPTEPTFFPLAHGIPARVVRLRGYGNAIVPPLAAEFVKAYLDYQG